MTAAAASPRPPRPECPPFNGLPDFPALRELQGRPQWVVWDYVWNEKRGIYDKPPKSAKPGRSGKSNDPSTWAPYELAERRAKAERLAGVGFVLVKGDIYGIDLDDCRDPMTGKFQAWARHLVDLAETYMEVSPSGCGLRLFVRGEIEARAQHAAQVELYSDGRYLTVTGNHVEGTPTEIREAPRTVEYLIERADQFQAAMRDAAEKTRENERKRQEQARQANPQRTMPAPAAKVQQTQRDGGTGPDPFWSNVNSRALASLHAWVPTLFPGAQQNGGGVWRVTSRDLGRDREEDLSLSPQGIKDFGEHDMGDPNDGKRTPISLVIEHGGAGDAKAAAHWLCQQMGARPEDLGWRGARRAVRDELTVINGGNATPTGPSEEKPSRPARPERTAIPHQGVMVPVERDRLEIAKKLDAAPEFPVETLPDLMRGAVEALAEHVQAPRSLCAHSVVSATMLVTQGLADIEVGPIGSNIPLSLFMLAVAVSGERKSACDNLALRAVSEHEERLRQDYEEASKIHRAAKAAHDAEKRNIERNTKIGAEERRSQLMNLQEPAAPLLPVMRAKEPNLEGLMNLLANGQASVGIFTSEGGQFLGGHGMGEEARTRNITGLSELWDSGSAQRVRSKETTFLQGRRVGISLAAQPKVASSLLSDELAKDQGFVGRFLITMPDSTIGQRQIRETGAMQDDRLRAFHRQCRQVLSIALPLRDGSRNEVSPPTLRLSPEAWEVWKGLAQSIEDECGPEGMWLPVRSAALKMAENVARIAGILTVFADPQQATRRGGVVSGEAMAAAAAIGLFYLKEAVRLTGHSILDPETRALKELADWLISEKVGIGKLVNPGFIQRRAPNHLRADAATTQAQVRKLVEFGALELVGKAEVEGRTVREAYRVTGEEVG